MPFSSSYLIKGVRPQSSGPDEVEVLQTDVMRFMAILGLCLMIIFALVQSLPQTPADSRPEVQTREMLMDQIQALQARMQRLETEVARKQQELAKAKQAAKVAQTKKEAVQEKLDQMQDSLDAQGQRLTDLEQAVEEKRERMSSLQEKVRKARQELDHIQGAVARAEMVETQDDQKARKDHTASQDSKKQPEQTKEKQGFSLRFASQKALDTLIRQGQVAFYAVHGEKAWRLQLHNGKAAFQSTKAPPKVYEMTRQTVPDKYAQALKRKVAVFGPDSITWGVTLPERSVASISQHMASASGGTLILQSDGGVSLE
jgi:hypothetical protein